MTEHEQDLDVTEDTPAAVQVQPDPFAAAFVFFELITHPARYRKRLEELRSATTAAKRAEASLAGAQAAQDEHIRTTRAEIEREQKELLSRRAATLEAEGGWSTANSILLNAGGCSTSARAAPVRACRRALPGIGGRPSRGRRRARKRDRESSQRARFDPDHVHRAPRPWQSCGRSRDTSGINAMISEGVRAGETAAACRTARRSGGC
jgi:hypothetical protein